MEPACGGLVHGRAHDGRPAALCAQHGLTQRKPQDVIHRTDQGSQYTRPAFGERCIQIGVRPSTSTVSDAYNNAMAESFFASPEAELIERHSFESKAQARMAVFTWIEGWYNARRRHSGLGYLSPLNYERSQQARFNAPTSMTRSMPTGHLKWFEDQTGNRPPDRVNSNPKPLVWTCLIDFRAHRVQSSS